MALVGKECEFRRWISFIAADRSDCGDPAENGVIDRGSPLGPGWFNKPRISCRAARAGDHGGGIVDVPGVFEGCRSRKSIPAYARNASGSEAVLEATPVFEWGSNPEARTSGKFAGVLCARSVRDTLFRQTCLE